MSQKSRPPPNFQSIKSLLDDFRFMGSPTSDQFGKFGDAKLGYSNITSSSILENSDSGDVAVDNSAGSMDLVNEDSPYGMNVVSVEYRPSSGDEDSDSVAPPVPSVSASRSEHRWGDTNLYAAKKTAKASGCLSKAF